MTYQAKLTPMGNEPGLEQQQGRAASNEELVQHDHVDADAHQGPATKFSSKGPKPGVMQGFADKQKPTASERGYGNHKKPKEKHEEISNADAEATVIAAADIVQHSRRKMIGDAPVRFQPALTLLWEAVTEQKREGVDRVQMLDAAMVMLEPAIAPFRQEEERAVWLNDQLMKQVGWIRSSARYGRAMDRVNNSLAIDGKIVEVPQNDEPRQQAALLHQEIQKMLPTITLLNEQVIRAGHDTIHHEAHQLAKGKGGKGFGPGTLLELQNLLLVVDGFLILSDEEFQHHLNHIQGFMNGVATYSELVKAVTEIAGGGIAISASYAAIIAKMAGDTSSAAMASGLAQNVGLALGNVVAGIEIVHGIAVLLDPHATGNEKVAAAAHASAGAAWFIGSRVGGAAVGAAASTAILITYAELKLMAHLYWEANLGITSGLMRPAFETIQRDGASIATTSDKLTKVNLLIQQEKDPAMLEDLGRVKTNLIKELGGDIDYLLSDCAPRGYEAGVAKYPGAHGMLREIFDPVKKYKGAHTEHDVIEGAKFALERVTWSLAHAGDIIVMSAKQKHLSDLEHELAKQKEGEGGEGGEGGGHH